MSMAAHATPIAPARIRRVILVRSIPRARTLTEPHRFTRGNEIVDLALDLRRGSRSLSWFGRARRVLGGRPGVAPGPDPRV